MIKMNLMPKLMFFLQNVTIIKGEIEKWQKKIIDFIWQRKKTQVKMKIMIDNQLRGGLQGPNLLLIHEAISFAWLKEWMVLKNKTLLNLESFNKKYGWHGYFFYDKGKLDNMFSHHLIRGSLLSVWMKYFKRIGEKKTRLDIPHGSS